MATIGWVKIGMATDTSGLSKGARAAVSMVQDLKSQLLGLAGAIGAGFAARGLGDWVKSSITGAAETKVLADRLGISSEAFQKLSYAAGTAHVDSETFAHSIEKMNERLAEVAISGEGPAAEALKRFGISAQGLVAAGPEKSFKLLLGVLREIPNPMERSKVAMDLFGKSGQGMINLAQQGSAGLQKLGDQASALGVAMSDVDTAKLAEADVAFTQIGASIQGVGNSIAVELAPYITAVTDQFINWMSTGTKTSSYVAQAMDWVTTAVGGVADVVQVLQAGFYGLRSVFSGVVADILSGIDWLVQGFGWVFEKITGTKLELTNFFKVWSDNLKESSKADWDQMGQTFGKEWAHNAVRQFVDDVKTGAQQRAELNVKKSEQFRGAGTGVTTPKVVEPGFAGASELGSKEAYSSIVKSKAMGSTTLQNRIEANTRMTAEATTRAATALSSMAQRFDEKSKGQGELGTQMTAGN